MKINPTKALIYNFVKECFQRTLKGMPKKGDCCEMAVITQGDYLIVTGDDLFSKKYSIKSYGFRWDSRSKSWFKPLEQHVA